MFVHAALLLSFIEAVNVVTELSVQTLVVCGTPPVIPYYHYVRELIFNNHFMALTRYKFCPKCSRYDYYSKVDREIILLSVL